uniref:Aquarius_N domain-containing protein n=1 Tax=Macrostomum lignano TaxID=282301 RepID=A0A1I8I075_9PLAT
TTSSFISNSISNSPSNLSLTENRHLLQAAALTNPMVESRAATISAYRLLNSEENWSNSNCEFDSDSNARLNIRNSSSSTRSEHSSEQVAKAYREADQPLLTLDFGLQNSVKASVRVASPVEATHCSRSASPCGGCSRTSGSDSGSPESQTRLERSYNIKLQPAVKLHRTIADPLPGQLDMRQVRHNFKLVKLRQHPMQLDAEGRRLEDVGVSRLDHILNRRLVQLHKNSLIKDGGKRPDSELSTSAAYPEWLSFQLRIMKTFAATRWMLFVAQRKKLRSSEPDNIERRANVRESHKYNPKYIDVWSTSVSVSVKDGSLLRDAIDPAFARVGLDKRSDFRYSVGCFLGDKRQIPVEVFPSTPVRDLYRMNASEIFLNDNKLILFDGLPESVHGYPGWGKDFRKEEPKPAVKKKGCCSCR